MNNSTKIEEESVSVPTTWLDRPESYFGIFDEILPQRRKFEPGETLFPRAQISQRTEIDSHYRSPSKRRKWIQSLLKRYRRKYQPLLQLDDEPVDREAFERTFHLLFLYLDRMSLESPKPYLTDGDEGSVDIVWRSPSRTVMVNVPSREPIYFSATDGEFSLSGYLPEDRVEAGLLDWIQRT